MPTLQKVKKTVHLDIKTVSKIYRIQMRELQKSGKHIQLSEVIDQAVEALWDTAY